MLYPSNNVNKIIYRKVWVTQKNIEAEENKALKKEELKEKIRKNRSLMILLKSIVIFYFLLATYAHAYLDPGTGSIILQGILGAIAAGFVFFGNIWLKLKNFFKKVFKKDRTIDEKNKN